MVLKDIQLFSFELYVDDVQVNPDVGGKLSTRVKLFDIPCLTLDAKMDSSKGATSMLVFTGSLLSVDTSPSAKISTKESVNQNEVRVSNEHTSGDKAGHRRSKDINANQDLTDTTGDKPKKRLSKEINAKQNEKDTMSKETAESIQKVDTIKETSFEKEEKEKHTHIIVPEAETKIRSMIPAEMSGLVGTEYTEGKRSLTKEALHRTPLVNTGSMYESQISCLLPMTCMEMVHRLQRQPLLVHVLNSKSQTSTGLLGLTHLTEPVLRASLGLPYPISMTLSAKVQTAGAFNGDLTVTVRLICLGKESRVKVKSPGNNPNERILKNPKRELDPVLSSYLTDRKYLPPMITAPEHVMMYRKKPYQAPPLKRKKQSARCVMRDVQYCPVHRVYVPPKPKLTFDELRTQMEVLFGVEFPKDTLSIEQYKKFVEEEKSEDTTEEKVEKTKKPKTPKEQEKEEDFKMTVEMIEKYLDENVEFKRMLRDTIWRLESKGMLPPECLEASKPHEETVPVEGEQPTAEKTETQPAVADKPDTEPTEDKTETQPTPEKTNTEPTPEKTNTKPTPEKTDTEPTPEKTEPTTPTEARRSSSEKKTSKKLSK